MADYRWIDRAEELAAAAEGWRAAGEIAVDTEFVFERTFRPRLGLIQVAGGGDIALVDPRAVGDLTPLAAVLRDAATRKLLHAAAGDVAVLRLATGEAPAPLLDTQVAAAFAGLGAGLSYAALVRELLAVDLPKHETRTDWLRRPLSADQLRYAAEDVLHLPPVAAELERRLAALGRLDWALEESARLAAGEESPAPEEAWRRVRGIDRLPPRARRIARLLAAWREREAERLDLARPFLLRDATLLALARREQIEARELAKLPEYDRRRHAPHAAAWLAALAAARQAVDADPGAGADPPRPASALDREAREKLERAIAERVAQHAAGLDLPPELLLSRRQRGRLYAAWDGRAPLSAGLAGFRLQLFGAELDALAADFTPATPQP